MELVAEDVSQMMAKYSETLVCIMDNFNSCRLICVMPSFHQYVDMPTRKHNTLDLCCGTISDAFIAHAHALLGYSDHNVVFLLPHYKPELKRDKPHIHLATFWSEDAITQLQGCSIPYSRMYLHTLHLPQWMCSSS